MIFMKAAGALAALDIPATNKSPERDSLRTLKPTIYITNQTWLLAKISSARMIYAAS